MHINTLMKATITDGKFDSEARGFAASAMWAAAQRDENADTSIPVNAKFGKHHRAANIVIHAIENAIYERNRVARLPIEYAGYEDTLDALFESIDAVREGF